MKSVNYLDLYFGLSSAEAEVAQDSDRFLRSFYDRWSIASRVDKNELFLLIGPKGAGKTAVSEYIRLDLISRHGASHVFARTLNLDEVSPSISPISSITQKLASDQATGITDSAWRLFLSLRLFEMMMADQSCSLTRDHRMIDLAHQLAQSGLSSGDGTSPNDFLSILRKVRENRLTFSLGKLVAAESANGSSEDVRVSSLGHALQRIVLEAESDNYFVLSIDGLDRIISDNDAYWLTLAALLRVGADLHHKLQTARSKIRFLVMCRSDVFRKISFADADKIAGDSALYIDWGAAQAVPQDSELWDYLSAKAGVTPERLFEPLPSHVTVGLKARRPRKVRTLEYLLTSTRSTPREMTMLMRRLQGELPPAGYITSERIRSAVDKFSSRDLLTTVKAEATGVLGGEINRHLEHILSALPAASDVTREDLEGAVVGAGIDRDRTIDLAEFMFMAGLLGNYNPATHYVQFYHRRDTYTFRRSGPWQLHRAIMYAFNIPFTRGM